MPNSYWDQYPSEAPADTTTGKPSAMGKAAATAGGVAMLAGEGLAKGAGQIRDLGLGAAGGTAGLLALRELLKRQGKVAVREHVRVSPTRQTPIPKHLVKLTAKDAADPAFAPRKAGTIIRRTTYERIKAGTPAPGPNPRPAGPKPNPAAVANPEPAAVAGAPAQRGMAAGVGEGSNVVSIPSRGQRGTPLRVLAERYRLLGPKGQALARRVSPPSALPKGVPLEPENPYFRPEPSRGVGPVGIGPAMNAIMMLLNIMSMPQQMRDSDALFKQMNAKRLRMPYVPPPEPA